MLDNSKICEKYLRILGRKLTIVMADGSEDIVFAAVQPIWKKNKTKFESNHSEIGLNFAEFYNYIGPSSLDITALKEDDYVIYNGNKYFFVRVYPIEADGKIQFYSGILKRVWESDYDDAL